MDRLEASSAQSRPESLTCLVRYELDPERIADFEAYARYWIRLIERHGGKHHGYFISREAPDGSKLSFPGLGREGPGNVAIALFTFPSDEAYASYRRTVRADPDCARAEDLLRRSACVRSYERNFVRAVQPA